MTSLGIRCWRTAGVLVVALLVSAFLLPVDFDEQGREFSSYTETIPDSNVGIDMVPIEGGAFVMGASEDEGTQHQVQVDDFWMGAYEITWEQYDQFTSEVVSRLQNRLPYEEGDVQLSADAVALPTQPYVDMSFGMGRDGFPAINMTHYAAVMFTKWLTAKTGTFYRLPTEAEWEYACRAGSDTQQYVDDAADQLDAYEWHHENSEGGYNAVGTKESNPFGLYDMKGNVAEWTTDQYLEDYHEQLDGDPAINPWIKPTELYPRAVRGGSWQDEPADVHCVHRRGSQEDWKRLDPQFPKSLWWHTSASFLGFRIVRPRESPSEEEMEEFWVEPMEDL